MEDSAAAPVRAMVTRRLLLTITLVGITLVGMGQRAMPRGERGGGGGLGGTEGGVVVVVAGGRPCGIAVTRARLMTGGGRWAT